MTRERFREVLNEYSVLSITSIIPEKVTEEELRKILDILIIKRGNNDTD